MVAYNTMFVHSLFVIRLVIGGLSQPLALMMSEREKSQFKNLFSKGDPTFPTPHLIITFN
jgi:hypothetical protein